MATAGQLIAQANFSTDWASTVNVSAHSNQGQVRYVYICAPCWCVNNWCTYWWLGGSGILQLYISYWTGSEWSSETHYETDGSVGTEGASRWIYHNCSNNNFPSDYPLWRFRYYPSRSNDRWGMDFYAGSWGKATTNYPKGKKVFSCGRTDGPIYNSGTTNADTKVVNEIFNPTLRRGSPILASNDSELIWAPYLEPENAEAN